MSWSATMRGLRVVSLTVLALGLSACGDDDKGGGGSSGESDAGGDGPGTGLPRPFDGGAGIDSSTPRPTSDGGSEGQLPVDDGSVIVPPTPQPLPDGAVPVFTTPLQADGNKGSICYAESECNGDDLTCYAPGQLGDNLPGICTDDCATDKDCPAVQGIAQTCSPDGQCRIDCTGTGMGDGMCPINQVCRDTRGGGLLSPAQWRCTYPVGSGSKVVKQYGKCNTAHGAGDCEGTRTCYVPTPFITLPITLTDESPGFCTSECAMTAECPLPAGVTAEPVCEQQRCGFDCSRSGSRCPDGLDCRDIDDSLLGEQYRCRAID